MKRFLRVLSMAFLFGMAAPVVAAGVDFNTPPPGSAIVIEDGLEWIWAAPCAPVDPSCGKPGNPAGVFPIQGFALPSQQQWADSWSNLAELVAAFVTPSGNVCGSPWMSSLHSHCDANDLQNGHIWHAFANGICNPSYFDGCEAATAETFLVRGARAVPEPATLALLAGGLGVMGWLSRRRKR